MTLEKAGTTATTFIYALSDPRTGALRYIGKADRPAERFKEHLRQKNSDDHRGRWIRSLLIQGLQPGLQVLYETPKYDWPEVEKRFIHTARSLGFSLVNSTDGGEGITMTPERCARISASMRKRGPELSARQQSRTLSAATRAKISAAQKLFWETLSTEDYAKKIAGMTGRVVSAETREKIGAAHLGRKASPETRAKISAVQRGKKISPETLVRMSEAQRGKKRSPETRARLSAAKSGKNHPLFGKSPSLETRARMSEAHLRRHARKREEKLQNGNATL